MTFVLSYDTNFTTQSLNFTEVQKVHWNSLKFTEFHWSSLKFTEVHWSSESSLKFTEVHWISLKITEVHWGSLMFSEVHWISLNFTEVQKVHWSSLKFTKIHWSSLKFIEIDWALKNTKRCAVVFFFRDEAGDSTSQYNLVYKTIVLKTQRRMLNQLKCLIKHWIFRTLASICVGYIGQR